MIEASARIHSTALVDEGAAVGAGSRVWAFAHILPGAVIGRDCNICDHTFIEGRVRLGDRVTVKCGVYIWDGMTVGDDVFRIAVHFRLSEAISECIKRDPL